MQQKIFSLILSLFTCFYIAAQPEVTQAKMAEIYEQVKTPYKYGLAIAPTTNNYKVDCPTVFRKGDKWYMTYLVYNGRTGTNGRGYETWMAESDNLLEWKTKGRVLSFREGTWDMNQRGGFPSLPDINWGGSYKLQTFKGKYWMTYIGGASAGYESGPLKIGMAFTPESKLTDATEWDALPDPILTPKDKDGQWFENITQYKSTVYWDKKKTLGAPFVMFYNAGGINPTNKIKAERIGIALSKDMKHWKRYPGNPVFTHEEGITGDAYIQKIGDVYVMFYFSAFRADRPYKAFNTFACSYDLIHWADWKGADLIIPSKSYDNLFAHKSCLINYQGIVYHFYCGVNQDDQRGIAVATSKPMGHSALRFPIPESKERRTIVNLNEGWKTWMKDTLKVNIPHNWDDYYGYRQLTHGNLHGTATYQKTFIAPKAGENKQYFIRFEGVGTFATVTLNGISFGRHPGGRVSFTLNVTTAIKPGENNTLTVVAEHPEMITDMPWVCGGCSSEYGFSEGSQPLGIFRPVILEVTDDIRIEPFGIHIWNNTKADSLFIETEVKNYGTQPGEIEIVNKLNNADGIGVLRLAGKVTLASGETRIIRQVSSIPVLKRWDIAHPYLYKLASMIKRGDKTTDEISTPYGIRTLSWPVKRNDQDGRFYMNEKPVFINGVCEYENQFGQSHAFSNEQIASRVKQIKAAGFNAFRDAHQPHNLEYQKYWDEDGILFWPQFSAHIWYDTPEFRNNFKQLLRQWVKERRNSPSLIMWGLQNESVLPKDFARECSDIIREMDPTTAYMRVITTCNGGEGTDWNVVQNWSGTYGGKIENYNHELTKPNQLLNGEYGAWRSLGLHTEPTAFDPKGSWSEDRMCQLLEMKIRLAEQAKDSVCGQFQWVFSSHDNPGRRQPDEAYRVIDKVGPFNYKGLVTPWEEPTDAYYMYRANYVSAKTDPMVYLVSHTWPGRFTKRSRATVEAYSNCDSVKLYNDATNDNFMGRKKNNGKGTHFMWENRDVRYNVLRAVGYFEGKPVAEDLIILDHLEKAPHFDSLYHQSKPLLKAEAGYKYLYRVNCGGDDYTDEFQQKWAKDDSTYSHSWGADFKGMNPYQASQGVTTDPIQGVRDWSLFGHFRFGRQRLSYHFAVPDGRYRVELYFTEPWHGTGGGVATDCEGLRVFDVALNDSVVLHDLDIWAESGHDGALKKVVYADVNDGKLLLSFPTVKAGQALISAIAIASTVHQVQVPVLPATTWSWQEAGSNFREKTPLSMLAEDKNSNSVKVYKASTATVKGSFTKKILCDSVSISFGKGTTNTIQWNITTGLAQVCALRFNYNNSNGQALHLRMKFIASDGTLLKDDEITFPNTTEKWRMISTTTGTFVNAGHYRVILSAPDMKGLSFESLMVQ